MSFRKLASTPRDTMFAGCFNCRKPKLENHSGFYVSNVDVPHYGAISLCEPCVGQLARLAGFVRPEPIREVPIDVQMAQIAAREALRAQKHIQDKIEAALFTIIGDDVTGSQHA